MTEVGLPGIAVPETSKGFRHALSRKDIANIFDTCRKIILDNDHLFSGDALAEFIKILFMKIRHEKSHGKRFTFERYKQDDHFNENPVSLYEFSIRDIIAKLSKINLSENSCDAMGIAYETFLSPESRQSLGQFFTPHPVSDFMVEILNPTAGEMISDPACGSGSLIIKASQYMKSGNQDLPENSVFGVEANPLLAQIAGMNLVANGYNHQRVFQHDGLLNIEGFRENCFDIVLANPPYGFYLEADNPLLKQNELGKHYREEEVLFIERCIRLLKPGGRMGIVLRRKIIDGKKYRKVRDYLANNAKIFLTVLLPREIFVSAGVAISTNLVFLKKYLSIGTPMNQELNFAGVTKIVHKAGVSRTGKTIENQLPEIAGKFKEFRAQYDLWSSP